MNKRPRKPSAITSHSRAVRQQRAHGPHAECRDCHERNPALLVLNSRPKRCDNCWRKYKGMPTVDDHHPAGHANSDFTVAVPANVHRQLTDSQMDWDPQTLRNIDGCPLRSAAGCLRGFIETGKAMVERLLLWIIGLLEGLSDWLLETQGASWWVGTPIERWATGDEI